jgi:hypothetical protein
MLNSSLTLRTRLTASALIKTLCLAAGVAFTFAPSALRADDKKPAAKEEAAEEADKEEPAPATPRSEAAALKEFKTEMAAIKSWMQAQQAKAKAEANPLAALKAIGEISVKFGKVRTDGLPDDLATHYKKMTGVVKKMAAIFKGMPEDETELKSWMMQKATDPEFGPKMQKLGKEANETGEKLKEIGKKYGLEGELNFDEKKDDDGADEDKDGDKKKEKPAKEKEEKEEK